MKREDDHRAREPLAAPEGEGRRASAPEDALIRDLRELPVHPTPAAAAPRVRDGARAAFVGAFEDDARWHSGTMVIAGQIALPTALASVVAMYLLWAFATAIALNR